MNRMTRPSESLISLSTALSRSSNSPRNLAPAIRAPRSSATTRLSLRPSGTSPRTMRWARPSTIAVLPTPGSPIRTGLFFVRRDRTWMTRRTSSSRPMTGSSLPALASEVRSRPYFSSAAYVPSGFWEVTRWPPRTLWRACRMASRPAPWRSRRACASPPASADAEQQVLGRDELVAETPGLGLGPLDDRLAPACRASASRPGCGPAWPGSTRPRPGTRAGPRRVAGASRPGRRHRVRRGRTAGARRRGWGSGAAPPSPGRRRRPPGPSG